MQDRREPEDNECDEAHLHGIRPEQRGGIGRTDELDEEDAKGPRDPNPDGSRIRGGTRHARRRNAGYLRLWRSRDTRPSMTFRLDDQGPRLDSRFGLRYRLRDPLAQCSEEKFHVLARLRGAVEVWSFERLGRLLHLVLAERGLVFQIGLVQRERHRDLADRAEDGLDPRIEVFEGVVTRDVRDGQDALGPMEVRLTQELSETFGTNDVPDRH